MADLSWKPGPPPLDVPGDYVCPESEFRSRTVVTVYANETCSVYSFEWQAIKWHFGPIPSPPSGETE